MRTILVIDDERPTLRMFELSLETYGYRVLTAATGEEGLAVFETSAPDIVLTDIKMPGMDGLEVLKIIKERRPDTEVIVITGHGDIDLALTALELRATDFIDKPIRREALEAALGRANARLDSLAAGAGHPGSISLERKSGVAIIHIRTNLGGEAEPYLTRAVRDAADAGGLLFAFSHDTSINGAGLDLLLQVVESSLASGHAAAVSGLSDNFARILDRLGVTAKAPRFAETGPALNYLAERGKSGTSSSA